MDDETTPTPEIPPAPAPRYAAGQAALGPWGGAYRIAGMRYETHVEDESGNDLHLGPGRWSYLLARVRARPDGRPEWWEWGWVDEDAIEIPAPE